MKKICFVLILLFTLTGLVWGQDIVREEQYNAAEVGYEVWINLVEAYINTALNDYQYYHYWIEAPYDDNPTYEKWNASIYVLYYTNGVVTMVFANNQTIEYLFLSNRPMDTNYGQSYIHVRWNDGTINRNGIQQLIRFVNLEHSRALAVIPRNFLTNDGKNYSFFIYEELINKKIKE